jgi:hypothetical protein
MDPSVIPHARVWLWLSVWERRGRGRGSKQRPPHLKKRDGEPRGTKQIIIQAAAWIIIQAAYKDKSFSEGEGGACEKQRGRGRGRGRGSAGNS